MNWKQLLKTDLGRLLAGRGAADTTDAPPRYFWQRIGGLFRIRGRRGPSALPVPSHGWRGPRYGSGRAWRQDVLSVSEYTRSLVDSNVPLAAGMEAAVREECRRRYRWTPQRVTRLVGIALLAVMMMVLGSGIAANPNGLGFAGIVQAGLLLVMAAWLVRLLFLAKDRRERVYQALHDRLLSGATVSEAMGSLPRFFPSHLVDLVAVGEETGDVGDAFDRFNASMLQSLDLSRRLRWVLRYVAFVFFLQCFIGSFLALKVLPVYVEINDEIYADVDYTAPLPAYVGTADRVVNAFDHLVYHWPRYAMAGAVVAMAVALYRFRRSRGSLRGNVFSPFLLVPWFRGLVVRQNLGAIALMLHGLLRGGVPLDQALGMCSNSDLHRFYRQWLSALREQIRAGETLGDALAKTRSRWFVPDSFVGQLEAGEYAGQLPAMLERVSDLYRRDVELRMRVLVSLALPIGVLSLGYLTMFMETLGMRILVGLTEGLIV